MQYEDDMHPKEAQDAAEKTALEELQVLSFSVFTSLTLFCQTQPTKSSF